MPQKACSMLGCTNSDALVRNYVAKILQAQAPKTQCKVDDILWELLTSIYLAKQAAEAVESHPSTWPWGAFAW